LLLLITLGSAFVAQAGADDKAANDNAGLLNFSPAIAATVPIDPDVAALSEYARQTFSAGAKPNFSPVSAHRSASGAHGAVPHSASAHGESPHAGAPHAGLPHATMPRYSTIGAPSATLKLPDDPSIRRFNDYVRYGAAMRVATAPEQRILRFHERRLERAGQPRVMREPDYATLMPTVRDEGFVKTWVALDQLEDSYAEAPQFDFVQILGAKIDGSKPILIAAQKQAKPVAGGRAPMVAPAPGDPDGRYFVGSKPCETCHAGLFDEFGETLMGRGVKSGKITAQGKMECETCHGPGSGHVNGGGGREKGGIRSFRLNDQRGVDVEDYNGICLNCHEKSDQTYWKASVHESRGVACVNCHTVMRKVQARYQIKFPTVGETCYQCHKDRKAQAQRTSHMPLRENKITCASCHNPHGSPTEALLKEATVNDTCYTCHADKRGPFLFEHAPVRENCLNCHQPHGSNHESLLIVARPRLCQQCHPAGHSQAGLSAAPGGSMRYAAGSSCQNCHTNIHGSNSPSGGRWHR
jgi:DmsE family decaheme c-type cytochrome